MNRLKSKIRTLVVIPRRYRPRVLAAPVINSSPSSKLFPLKKSLQIINLCLFALLSEATPILTF